MWRKRLAVQLGSLPGAAALLLLFGPLLRLCLLLLLGPLLPEIAVAAGPLLHLNLLLLLLLLGPLLQSAAQLDGARLSRFVPKDDGWPRGPFEGQVSISTRIMPDRHCVSRRCSPGKPAGSVPVCPGQFGRAHALAGATFENKSARVTPRRVCTATSSYCPGASVANRVENAVVPSHTNSRPRAFAYARSVAWFGKVSELINPSLCASLVRGIGGICRAGRREGRYLLRTNLSGREPAQLWQFYIQLVEVEAAFKNLKDDL